MTHEVTLPSATFQQIREHVLRHIQTGERQEDLCFSLWRPSTGSTRYSAIISEVIPPYPNEVELHGNVSFQPEYLSRTLQLARVKGMGVALIHSHPVPGWQGLSEEDITAERDRVGPPSAITGLPVVGVTMGTNGDMSARFWYRKAIEPAWCKKVRVTGGKTMHLTYNEHQYPTYSRHPRLKRTIDSWGLAAQQKIARLKIGIVGAGSVGAVAAEMLARMGVENILLVDPDQVEQHNLDRLIHASEKDVGTPKVQLLAPLIRRAATAQRFHLEVLAKPVQSLSCYQAVLDCDVLFSCVDRPLPKDLLNNVAFTHCIPLIFGGIHVSRKADGRLANAMWTVSRIAPDNQCLRCSGQYSTADVVQEQDGSLDDPTYIHHVADEHSDRRNQNVIIFSIGLASQMVSELVRYVIADPWWSSYHSTSTYDFVRHRLSNQDGRTGCEPHCLVHSRTAVGDTYKYPYLLPEPSQSTNWTRRVLAQVAKLYRRHNDD